MSHDPSPAPQDIATVVRSRRQIAHDIHLFELVSADPGKALPPFTAGSHVDVLTPGGTRRQYSLCNAPSETHRYQIAVKLESAGQGGSRSMIEDALEGTRLFVSPPNNYFGLEASANRFLLIAGGIGITPLMSMAQELMAQGRDFRLVYCTRSPELTAFAEELAQPRFAPHVLVHHDYGDPTASIDLASLLRAHEAGTHLYCCGPGGLMHAVREQSRHWPSGEVHFEDFTHDAKEGKATDVEFVVKLARQGASVDVRPGESILDALRKRGYSVPSSCESGTCASCRTAVLDGVPDHRDYILDEDETAEIMICVSRAKTRELVLDL